MILLLALQSQDINASCCWSRKFAHEDVLNQDVLSGDDKLSLRKYSFSTSSTSSDETSLESSISYDKKRNDSFCIYNAGYDGNFSKEVVATTKNTLLTQHKFNRESADCFMWIKSSMNSFDYEGPLEKTGDVRRHALKYLNERDFFPSNYLEDSRKNFVYMLQILLQKRYALLNYCMKLLLNQPIVTSEFFSYFSDEASITQNFPTSLANLVARNPAIQMPETLKEKLSRANEWIIIIAAFGSYPAKKSYSEYFRDFIRRKQCCFW